MREQFPTPRSSRNQLMIHTPQFPIRFRQFCYLLLLILASNVLSHALWNREKTEQDVHTVTYRNEPQQLYLLPEAGRMIKEIDLFETKVREVAMQLQITPEWLMAVMYAESNFESSVYNRKGSGAVGLIQFMPVTAQELGTNPAELARMNPVDQLTYVYRYFDQVRTRYGHYESLTDLYLGVLYPKARKKDPCFLLYANPSQAYRMNRGLDENKDGIVTVNDIDQRMKRLFPAAYFARNEITL